MTQYTYFQQAGGQALPVPAVEITYGLERILTALQARAAPCARPGCSPSRIAFRRTPAPPRACSAPRQDFFVALRARPRSQAGWHAAGQSGRAGGCVRRAQGPDGCQTRRATGLTRRTPRARGRA